jgi:hypothetical protein
MRVTTIYRYARGVPTGEPMVDGFPNFYYPTVESDGRRLLLESGINVPKEVSAVDGERRPVIALRSSPWKAGGESTPWHDFFELDHGHVRYFGDHKVDTVGTVGSTRGNEALYEAALRYQAKTLVERAVAPPIMLFRAVTVGGKVKGYVEFCGVAIVERVETIVQRDPKSSSSFANYVFDLAVLSTAAESEVIDWRWIDDRRNPVLPLADTLRFAPRAWCDWLVGGATVLARVRRRVASARLLSNADQQPPVGSAEESTLKQVYSFFEGKKHAFEALAAKVAASVLGGTGGRYQEGWLTRSSGDGGADFVGRLDVGVGHAMTSLVVLGQAKCVRLDSSVSAEQLARVVARLRRGWIGVYVTTGTYSRSAQIEMNDDKYPVVLIDGRTLAETVRRLAMEGRGGDLKAFLAETTDEYRLSVSARQPEEVLSI